MPSCQSLLDEFAAIGNYIKAVREVLQSGHMPDMAGLDKRVSNLCAALTESAPETQQQCLPKLSHMLDQLDECERDLRTYHETHIEGQS
jgi:hypothetical protein